MVERKLYMNGKLMGACKFDIFDVDPQFKMDVTAGLGV